MLTPLEAQPVRGGWAHTRPPRSQSRRVRLRVARDSRRGSPRPRSPRARAAAPGVVSSPLRPTRAPSAAGGPAPARESCARPRARGGGGGDAEPRAAGARRARRRPPRGAPLVSRSAPAGGWLRAAQNRCTAAPSRRPVRAAGRTLCRNAVPRRPAARGPAARPLKAAGGPARRGPAPGERAGRRPEDAGAAGAHAGGGRRQRQRQRRTRSPGAQEAARRAAPAPRRSLTGPRRRRLAPLARARRPLPAVPSPAPLHPARRPPLGGRGVGAGSRFACGRRGRCLRRARRRRSPCPRPAGAAPCLWRGPRGGEGEDRLLG